MPHTVFVSGDNEYRNKELVTELLSAGWFIAGDDLSVADLNIELDDMRQKIGITAAGQNITLPVNTTIEDLIVIMRLLANASKENRGEEPADFPLMHKMIKVIGHDVRNPLNNILLATAQFKLESLPDPEETAIYIDIIERNCDRISNLMSEITEPLNEQALSTGQFFLKDLAESVVKEYLSRMADSHISLDFKVTADSKLLLDADKMQVALGHVIENALESMVPGGRLSIIINKSLTGSSCILVRDTGCGISNTHSEKVFYPFFTTRERKRGVGLTLARKIIIAHGGSIQIHSEENAGTEVIICFPQ